MGRERPLYVQSKQNVVPLCMCSKLVVCAENADTVAAPSAVPASKPVIPAMTSGTVCYHQLCYDLLCKGDMCLALAAAAGLWRLAVINSLLKHNMQNAASAHCEPSYQ